MLKIGRIKQKIMNTRSAVWLISILCIFSILMTVLVSVIGCEEKDPGGSSVSGGEYVYYPPTDTKTDTESTSLPTDIPETSEAETSSDITIAETTSYETSFTDASGLFSLKIKGNYTPSESAVDEFYAAAEKFGRSFGFTAVDINTGVTISYNESTPFATASIIKASLVYYACKQVDLGKASLDEKLTYTSADTVHGNGVIGKSGVGTVFTLREVIYHTVNTSDNEGYYMLLRRFGRKGHDEIIRSLGSSTGLISSSRWPSVSAEDFARVWQEIYDYRNGSTTGKWLYELFLNVDKMHFFRNALGYETASKAGWNAESYNDSGIIYGNRTYIFVLLSSGSYYSANKNDFNAIVKAVDSMMNEYAACADPMPETERFEEDLPEPLPYVPSVDTEKTEDTTSDRSTSDSTSASPSPIETDTPETSHDETSTDTEPPIETDTSDVSEETTGAADTDETDAPPPPSIDTDSDSEFIDSGTEQTTETPPDTEH